MQARRNLAPTAKTALPLQSSNVRVLPTIVALLIGAAGWFYMFYSGNACCGSNCEPCALTFCRVVDRVRELVSAGEAGA